MHKIEKYVEIDQTRSLYRQLFHLCIQIVENYLAFSIFRKKFEIIDFAILDPQPRIVIHNLMIQFGKTKIIVLLVSGLLYSFVLRICDRIFSTTGNFPFSFANFIFVGELSISQASKFSISLHLPLGR